MECINSRSLSVIKWFLVSLVLALGILASSPQVKSAQREPPPSIDCAADQALVPIFTNMRIISIPEPEASRTIVTPNLVRGSEIVIWSAVGNPQEGCPETRHQTCNQGQDNEEFTIYLNGQHFADIEDHGEDQWREYRYQLEFALAGNQEWTFFHTRRIGNNDQGSVGIVAGICYVREITVENPLLVSSAANDRILLYDGDTGEFVDVLIDGAIDQRLNGPIGMAVSRDNALYVVNFFTDSILKYSLAGKIDESFTVERCPQRLIWPNYVLFDQEGALYATSQGNNRIMRYTPDGRCLGSVSIKSRGYEHPLGITLGPDNLLYISSFTGQRILRFDGIDRRSIQIFSHAPKNPRGLVFDNQGNLLIGAASNQVRVVNEAGKRVDVLAKLPGLNHIDIGPDERLYISVRNFGNRKNVVFNNTIVRLEDGIAQPFLDTAPGILDNPIYFLFMESPLTHIVR